MKKITILAALAVLSFYYLGTTEAAKSAESTYKSAIEKRTELLNNI